MIGLKTAELDFVNIKNNFISFLRNQEEFAGFNFEGSSLNVLLDILSYNTYYQSVYNNMVANEMFLSSAILRQSIVSTSKTLGYFPKSVKSSRAKIKVIVPPASVGLTNVTIPKNTIFKAIGKDDITYSFHTNESYNLLPFEFEFDGAVRNYAVDVDIYEGILTTYTFIVEDPSQIFVLPFPGLDDSSMSVVVLNSTTDFIGADVVWKRTRDMNDLNPESKVYFLEENSRTGYDLYFGDGIFGKKLERGNVVIVEFRVSNGQIANDIGSIGTENNFFFDGGTTITIQPSSAGSDIETAFSVKRNAPKKYTTSNRAVTAKDYEALILEEYPYVSSIRCWGGEDNHPPQYGKVFVTIKPTGGTSLSVSEKQAIIESISRSKAVVGTSLEFIDPELIYINYKIQGKIKRDLNLKITNVSNQIKNFIILYSINNLDEFYDSVFKSNLITSIMNSISTLDSISCQFHLEKRITPRLNIRQSVNLDFNNAIYHPFEGNPIPSVTSSTFKTEFNGKIYDCVLEDDGSGKMNLYDTSNNQKNIIRNVGSVNYETGIITLVNFSLTSYTSPYSYINVFVKPEKDDLYTNRNTIMSYEFTSPNFLKIDLDYNTGSEGLNNYSNPLRTL